MFQKTKIRFYIICKPKICQTNEINDNSFAYYNKRKKTKCFMFKKNKTKKNRHFKLVKQENMLDSLNLSIMYVPKQKKIEFYISFIFTKKHQLTKSVTSFTYKIREKLFVS